VLEMGQYLIDAGDAAVQYDRQAREFPLELIHTIVVQWRDAAVVLWAEPLQDRYARVDDERIAAGRVQSGDKFPQEFVTGLVIDADTRLYSHWHIADRAHFPETTCDDIGTGHQTSAELAALNSVARAADIDVYFIVTRLRTQLCGVRHHLWLAAAELQGDGMLRHIKLQQSLCITVNQRRGSHHLCIKSRTRRKQSQEETTMLVGPVHHRRN